MGGLFSAIGNLIYVLCKALATILELVGMFLRDRQDTVSYTTNNKHAASQHIDRNPLNNVPNHNNGTSELRPASSHEGLFEVLTAQKDRRIWVVSIDRKNTNNSYFKTRVKIRMNEDQREKYYNYEFKVVNNMWTYHTASGAWAPVAGTATANGILTGILSVYHN